MFTCRAGLITKVLRFEEAIYFATNLCFLGRIHPLSPTEVHITRKGAYEEERGRGSEEDLEVRNETIRGELL